MTTIINSAINHAKNKKSGVALSASAKLLAASAVIFSLFGVSTTADAVLGQANVIVRGTNACNLTLVASNLIFPINAGGGPHNQSAAVNVKANCGYVLYVDSVTGAPGVPGGVIALLNTITPAIFLPVTLDVDRVGSAIAVAAPGGALNPATVVAGIVVDDVSLAGLLAVVGGPIPAGPAMMNVVVPLVQLPNLLGAGIYYDLTVNYTAAAATAIPAGVYEHTLRFSAESKQ